MKYEFYMGSYHLIEGEYILSSSDKVSIVFSKEEDGSYILHKHGNPDSVQNWITKTKQVFRENGFIDIANSFYMITGKFPIEDLNSLIEMSGWVKYFLKKHNISLEYKETDKND